MTTTDTPVDEEPIPPTLGKQFETAFALDNPPETFGEFTDAIADAGPEAGLDPDLEALCVAEQSAHVADVDGERHHFQCVLDTFLLPALLDADRIDVTSRSPHDGESVELTVTPTGVTADPPDAVASFGAARDVDPPVEGEFDPELAYAQVCPYINAFPSRHAYERWAGETTEAVTIGLPVERGVELAGLLVDTDPFVTEG